MKKVLPACTLEVLEAAPPTTHSHKLVQLALPACLQGIVADMSKRKKKQLTLR